MAHNISTAANSSGEAVFAGKPAWHGLGTVIPGDAGITALDALRVAGLDWLTRKVRLLAEWTSADAEDRPLEDRAGVHDETTAYAVGDRFMTARSVSGEPVFFGEVSAKYAPIHNRDAFGFMDSVFKASDVSVRYESAGALRDGATVWMLARLQGYDVAVTKKDTCESYLLLSTSHDGSAALTVLPTSVRVVCQNTLRIAHAAGEKALSISHVGDVEGKLAAGVETVRKAVGMFDAFATAAKALHGIKLSANERDGLDKAVLETILPYTRKDAAGLDVSRVTLAEGQSFLDAVLAASPDRPSKAAEKAWGKALATRQSRIEAQAVIREMVDREQKRLGERVVTAWLSFNGVTGYLDHVIGGNCRTPETRFESLTDGPIASIKDSVLDTVLAYTSTSASH